MIWLIAAAYAETLSTPGLSSLLTTTRTSTDGSVVLVAGTGEDEELVREAVAAGLLPRLRVVRGSGTTAAAYEKSRTNAGVACAIGLSAADDGRWQVIPSGACGPAFPSVRATTPAPAPRATPTPAPRATPAAPPPKVATKARTPKKAPDVEVVEAVPAPPPPPPLPWNEALVEALLALPDHAARRTHLAEVLAADRDPGHTLRAAQTVAVVTQLEVSDRTDPSVVRFFLEAALSDDADTRSAALEAAAKRGDPPRPVVVIAAAPAGTPAPDGATAAAGATETTAGATAEAGATETTAGATAEAGATETTAGATAEAGATETTAGATAEAGATGTTAGATAEAGATETTAGATAAAGATETPLDPLAALRAYKARHLARGVSAAPGTSFGPGAAPQPTWAVYRGGSAPLDTAGFAEAVGDADTLAYLRDQRTASQIGGGALLVGGTLLGATGIGMLDNDDPVAPALLVGSGSLAVLGGLGWIVGVPRAQRHVDRYYTVDAADAHIESYNAALRDDLGVDERDALTIDLQAAGPSVTPWVGVASVGLAGRF